MSLHITGNSHVLALAAGDDRAASRARVFALGNGRHEVDRFSRRTRGGVSLLVEQYAENLTRHTGRPTIEPGHTWGVLQVNHNARVYGHDTWLTHEPAEVAARDTVPVSVALVEEVVVTDQHGVRLFLTDLREAGVDVFAVSAPPPRRDHPALVRGVRPEVVRHLDTLARRTWSAWLDEEGIDLIDPPASSWAEDGFLLAEHAAVRTRRGGRDAHHANEVYGTLMMRKVLDHVAQRAGA